MYMTEEQLEMSIQLINKLYFGERPTSTRVGESAGTSARDVLDESYHSHVTHNI